MAFFGEGAMNQGMLLEAMNLAVVWKLPVVFVCKDSKWAITTVSATVTGGNLVTRAEGFGMPAREVNGTDVEAVWSTAQAALKRARAGKGPTFLLAACPHPEGHFLGDPLLRIARNPVKEMKKIAGPLMKSVTRVKGGSVTKRTGGLGKVTALIGKTTRDRFLDQKEPLKICRSKLKKDKTRLKNIEESVKEEVRKAVSEAVNSAE
jgi:pyruvate dehydrogenase E1 component alpha subunit